MLIFLSLLMSTFARAPAFSSLLTDAENKTSTMLEGKHAWNDVDFLRQMINQETVIRLSLVKNVQALVSDVNLMKKSITTSEMTISALQQTIETLNVRVDSLEEENKRLKESSVDYQERIHDLETTLKTINESVNSLNENLDTALKENDEKRQDIVNKTNRVLEDIKVEVRYLSVTLFDFKDHTATKNKVDNQKFIDIERHVNTSFEELQAENLKNKGEFNEIQEHIHNVEKVQTEYRKTVTENLTTTIAEVETQSRKSEYERLKLSSAVSSLETFRMNMTKSNCDKKMNVAFSAGIPSHNYDWVGNTLVFPDVIYSEGKGYDSNTGVFTAPTEGTYLFYISIQSALQKYIYLDIVLNGSAKVRSMAHYASGSTINIHQTGTNLVILYLTTGDRVWVKRGGGTGYYSDSVHVCTFSGIRLY
uniref:Paramyosin-like n=1 Tax=Crassostrea virginica TaxID=6565 RepID=A0A8B8AYQ3_CRAVI|nr:paramyosin-like [Crassostrea virginica]